MYKPKTHEAIRRVVVTGASAGAGRAIAHRFGKEGCRVALIARNAERLDVAKQAIDAAGGDAMVLPADVSDADAVYRARDAVVDAWQGIDVWINAAMATVVSPIAQMTPAEYRRVIDVTYMGYVHGTLAALETMRPAGVGHIVQVGSALAYRAIPLQSAYCAAKFAVRGFTDALRTELRHERSRICVSMIQMPGMNTPQFDWARNKFKRKYQPVGNVYRPEVAAEAAWRAATNGPAELWVGGSAIQAILGQFFVPRLMDRILAKSAWEGQLEQVPETPGRPDNLFQTVPGPFGINGRFTQKARPKAWMLDPDRGRVALYGAVAALFACALTRRSRADDHRRLRSRRMPSF